jgi:hypothetical protein
MATATVQVAVQRRIQLTLRAPSLATITQATVSVGGTPLPVTISGKTVATTFDYRQDNAMFRAEIAQSARLTLTSALGSGLELSNAAPPSGQLSADQLATLEVSPFTTSLVGTLGGVPGTSDEYRPRVLALSDWEGVTRRANYLASVLAAGESALPAGQTLYNLASDPIGTDLLIEETSLPGGPRSALFPASALGAPPNPVGTPIWLTRGGTNVDELALLLQLAQDGSGTLTGPFGAKAIAWSREQDGVNVTFAGTAGEAPPTLFTSGLVTRRGGACEFNVPKLFERQDRIQVRSLKLSPLAYAPISTSASGQGDAWIASVTGTKLKGFSLSGCQPLFDDADAGPSLAFDVKRGGTPPYVEAVTLGAGRWLVPFFGDSGSGRPLPQAVVDVSSNGSGVGPGGLPFFAEQNLFGFTMTYPGIGKLFVNAIAKFGNGYRVTVETERESGERRYDEAWFGRFDDQTDFGTRLKNVRLRGCCRAAALRILRFDAQGQAYWELTSGGFAPAETSLASRGTLTIPFSEDEGVVIDPVVPVDGRFLTYSQRIGEDTGSAEILTLEPATVPTP